VLTVLGPVDPECLGPTLMHEHLLLQTWIDLDDRERWRRGGLGDPPSTAEELATWHAPLTNENAEALRRPAAALRTRDANSLASEDILPELRAFAAAGGGTVVDFPPIEARRDPRAVAALARATGLHIVVGTSFYTEAWQPDDVDRWSTEDLHARMLGDIMTGMDGTDVRAGIVGETPADRLVTDGRENANARILRAAARTSAVSGAALSLHTDAFGRKAPDDVQRALDLVAEEQPDLSRVVVGHATAVDDDWRSLHADATGLLERGVSVEFDLIGKPEYPLDPTMSAVAALVRDGLGGQVLLSHDLFTKFDLRRWGGAGLIGVHDLAVPALRRLGRDERELDRILVDTPRRLLTLTEPRRADVMTRNT
jgi:phosphotriesterase-related protein